MCCWTHSERDKFDSRHNIEFTLADDEHLRCMCRHGEPCLREQAAGPGPELLCQWCREQNHAKWCDQLAGRGGMTVEEYARPDMTFNPLAGYIDRQREMILRRQARKWGP